MELPRRKFLHWAAAAGVLPTVSRIAWAQAYPTRPVRIIVGFPPASAIDVCARLIAQWLSERLGQSFFVENRPGASGNIAAEAVVRAPPDGDTLLMAGTFNSISAILYDNLKFNFARDIAPVASISRTAGVMVVNPSVPAKTVQEFIDYAKANPGRINMASAGPASAPGLYGELFKAMAGVNVVTVNYRGSGPAMIDLLSGQAHLFFSSLAPAIEYIKTGKLRALAITTGTRSEVLPEIPTLGEFVPGYEASGWQGLGAPANTSPQIIAILNDAVNAALADSTFKARLVDLGMEPFASSPAAFGKFIGEYTEKWGTVIRAANIRRE